MSECQQRGEFRRPSRPPANNTGPLGLHLAVTRPMMILAGLPAPLIECTITFCLPLRRLASFSVCCQPVSGLPRIVPVL